MAESECKKCHKPLATGTKCDACKQKGWDKGKKVGGWGTSLLTTAVAVYGIAQAATDSKQEEYQEDIED